MTLPPKSSTTVREGGPGSQDDPRPVRTPYELDDCCTDHPSRHESGTASPFPIALSEGLEESAEVPGDSNVVSPLGESRSQIDDYRVSRASPVKSVAVVFKERVEILYNMNSAAALEDKPRTQVELDGNIGPISLGRRCGSVVCITGFFSWTRSVKDVTPRQCANNSEPVGIGSASTRRLKALKKSVVCMKFH
jgi:hypothetical protein